MPAAKAGMPASPIASHVGPSALGQDRPGESVGERDGEPADARRRDAVELLDAGGAVVGQRAVPAARGDEGEAERAG